MTTSTVLDSFVSLRRAIALLRVNESKDLDLEYGHNQIVVLYRLLQSPASITELVERAFSDKASVTRTVASLEKMGLVKRKTDETDRRVSIIELTAKGRIKAQKAEDIRSGIATKLDNALSADERKQFALLIDKLTKNLSMNQVKE